MIIRGILFTALLSSVFFSACKPSTESQIKQWESNQAKSISFANQYPNFKPLLNAEMAQAQTAWASATALTDESAKAEKMKAANGSLVLVRKIGEVSSKLEGLNSKIEDINRLKLPRDKAARRTTAVNNALTSIQNVRGALMRGAADVSAAKVLLKQQVSDLISARGALDRAYTAVKPKKAKKKKKSKKNKK